MDSAVRHEGDAPAFYKRDLVLTTLVVDKQFVDMLGDDITYTVFYAGTSKYMFSFLFFFYIISLPCAREEYGSDKYVPTILRRGKVPHSCRSLPTRVHYHGSIIFSLYTAATSCVAGRRIHGTTSKGHGTTKKRLKGRESV